MIVIQDCVMVVWLVCFSDSDGCISGRFRVVELMMIGVVVIVCEYFGVIKDLARLCCNRCSVAPWKFKVSALMEFG